MPLSQLRQDLHPQPQEPSTHIRERGGPLPSASGAYLPERHCSRPQGRSPDRPRRAKKNAAGVEARIEKEGIITVPAPEEDAIEIDGLCIGVSPSLWLWTAASPLVGQIVGFVIGDRTDPMLGLVWSDVPQEYRDKPVFTDHLGAYARFFPEGQPPPCDNGTGLTNRVEGLNTKWRQRQSGLVRRSGGVHRKIEEDLFERFLLLVEGHNRECAKRWQQQQNQPALATQLNP